MQFYQRNSARLRNVYNAIQLNLCYHCGLPVELGTLLKYFYLLRKKKIYVIKVKENYKSKHWFDIKNIRNEFGLKKLLNYEPK